MLQSMRVVLRCSILFMLALCSGCLDVRDIRNSTKFVSHTGEELYIHTLNWGVTSDSQYTLVTKDAARLKNRMDTAGAIYGLLPFVYRFRGDTLAVFYHEGRDIVIRESFQSIKVDYHPLTNSVYMDIVTKAVKGEEGYQQVL